MLSLSSWLSFKKNWSYCGLKLWLSLLSWNVIRLGWYLKIGHGSFLHIFSYMIIHCASNTLKNILLEKQKNLMSCKTEDRTPTGWAAWSVQNMMRWKEWCINQSEWLGNADAFLHHVQTGGPGDIGYWSSQVWHWLNTMWIFLHAFCSFTSDKKYNFECKQY
jgi:hypothetical protein